MKPYKVKQHTRKKKNGVTVVKKHDRWGKRPHKNDPLPWLRGKLRLYRKEHQGLINGSLTSSSRHKAFISRRLRATIYAIRQKTKTRTKNNNK